MCGKLFLEVPTAQAVKLARYLLVRLAQCGMFAPTGMQPWIITYYTGLLNAAQMRSTVRYGQWSSTGTWGKLLRLQLQKDANPEELAGSIGTVPLLRVLLPQGTPGTERGNRSGS